MKQNRRNGRTMFRRRVIGKLHYDEHPQVRYTGTLRYFNGSIPLPVDLSEFKLNPGLGPNVWSRILAS